MSPADEDLDDLDDILDDFDAPPPAKAAASSSKPKPKPQSTADENNFEDELSRNMAALLASFGNGTPPPGSSSDPSGRPEGGEDDLAKLLEQIMGAGASGLDEDEGDDGEGLEKLLASLNQQPIPSGTSSSAETKSKTTTKDAPREPAGDTNGEKLSFEETIKRTMDKMKASEEESRKGADKVSLRLLAREQTSDCLCLDLGNGSWTRGRSCKPSCSQSRPQPYSVLTEQFSL